MKSVHIVVLSLLIFTLQALTGCSSSAIDKDFIASNRELAKASESLAQLKAEGERLNKEQGITSERKIGGWQVLEGRDRMDGTPFATIVSSSTGGTLYIRCKQGKTEAFVLTDIADDSAVRVRFDDQAPIRQTWSRSTDYQALFVSNAVGFAKRASTAKKVMIEYNAYHEGKKLLEVDLAGLPDALPTIATTCKWSK